MFDILLINPATERDPASLFHQTQIDELDKEFFEFKKLISPPITQKRYNREPPTGLLLLTAILEKAEWAVELYDCSISPNYKNDLKEIAQNFRMFGLTALTNTLSQTMEIARILKESNPNALIILGGPHVSFRYQEILENYPYIDLCAIGESENGIISLLDLILINPAIYLQKNITSVMYSNFEVSKLPLGFAIRIDENQKPILFEHSNINSLNKKRIYFSGWPTPVEIKSIPLPARHTLKYSYDVANVLFNRGCPNQCSFCSRQLLFKNSVRLRTLEQLKEELQIIQNNFRYKFVNFYDNININPTFFRQFLNMLIEMKFKIPWGCELRSDILTWEDCQLLKKAGCKGAATGIESADKTVLQKNFKYQDPEKVKEGIQLLKRAGIIIQAYFVIGLPGETQQSFEITLNYLKNLNLDHQDEIDFFIATPYPGSQLAENQSDFNIQIRNRNYDDYDCAHFIFDTFSLNKQDIYRMYKKASETVADIKLKNF